MQRPSPTIRSGGPPGPPPRRTRMVSARFSPEELERIDAERGPAMTRAVYVRTKALADARPPDAPDREAWQELAQIGRSLGLLARGLDPTFRGFPLVAAISKIRLEFRRALLGPDSDRGGDRNAERAPSDFVS